MADARKVSTRVVAGLVAVSVAGCATARGPRQADPTQSGAAAMRTWSRVAEVAPAAEIVVTTVRGVQARRIFDAADESRLIVLNFTGPALSAGSTHALRDMAAQHGDYFARIETGHSFQQGSVRLGRDGLVVDGRKVAELAQVVETISRADVREIRGPVVARGSALGAALGAFVGFAVGVVPGLGGASPETTWLALIASAAAGGYLGFRWTTHQTDGVVYQVP